MYTDAQTHTYKLSHFQMKNTFTHEGHQWMISFIEKKKKNFLSSEEGNIFFKWAERPLERSFTTVNGIES